jgi:thymidine kinase
MTLDLIMGPMFAGKSTELLRRLRRFEHAGRRCLLIKWKGDTRYSSGEEVVTHDMHRRVALSVMRIAESMRSDEFTAAEVVAIDEGQFFPDILETVTNIARTKIVIVSCLDGTFEQEPFPEIARLISKADTITKLSAICTTCKRDAPFTRRKSSGHHAALITVGGSELYVPCCRDCLYAHQTHTDTA